jgi:hypothetical protein
MLLCHTYFDLFICCEIIARNAIKNWYRVVCKCHVCWLFYLNFILRIWTKSCKFIKFISYETNLYTWWWEPHWYIDIETYKKINIILKSKKKRFNRRVWHNNYLKLRYQHYWNLNTHPMISESRMRSIRKNVTKSIILW